MTRDLGTYHPRRPHKMLGPLLTMLLNGVHDRHEGRVFVLQVGAGRGEGAPGLHRRLGDGWSGLLIEPHPEHFSALETLHASSERVAVLNLGISDAAANQTLWSLSVEGAARNPKQPAWRASLLRDRIAVAGVADADLTGVEVPFLRLDTVLGELGIDRAQLVVVNAGGHEDAVLRSFDLAAAAPSLVLVHSSAGTIADTACVAHLQASGLAVFRLGDWLAGFAPATLSVPLDELLTFFQRGIGQPEAES